MLLMDLAALYWVGLWQGLTAKNPNRAASGSVARILVLPPALWALVILAVFLISQNRQSDSPGSNFFMGLWLGLSLLIDIIFSVRARQKLLAEFRIAASHRYSTRPGFFRRLFTGSEPSANS
jgi:hypothetical protein